MTGTLIWLLIAISPDGRMDLIDASKSQRSCVISANFMAAESKRHLKQPFSYTCMPSTGVTK